MSKPKYTAGELAANALTIGASIMRGGRLTDRQKRRIDRIADRAKDRGAQADKA